MAVGNQPIIKKRNGSFSVAIFAENKQSQSGVEYISYSAVLQKSYKDPQTQEWKQQSINMFENNMAEVALLLQATAMALVDMKNPVQQPAAAPATAQAAQPAAQQPDLSSVADDCPF